MKRIDENGNKISALGDLYKALIGKNPNFGRLGQILRVSFKGDAGYMAKCLWQAPANRPAGDLLSYVQAMATKERKVAPKERKSGYTGMDND